MKKNKKGFTLIELLVVVAIIGILAAVGTVAYTGYTEGAKKSATKSNHAAVVKYIAAEDQKCNVGTDKVFGVDVDNTAGAASVVGTSFNCNERDGASVIAAEYILTWSNFPAVTIDPPVLAPIKKSSVFELGEVPKARETTALPPSK